MVNNIKIDVDNFALINKAEFELDQITIIKGMEGFGRGDFNKLLFSFLITLSSEGLFSANNMVRNEFFSALEKSLKVPIALQMEFNDFVKNDWDGYNVSFDYLNGKYEEYKKLLRKYRISVDTSIIEKTLDTFNEFKLYRSQVFQHMINIEFKNYSFGKYEDYEVNMFIDDYPFFIKHENNKLDFGLSYESPILSGNVLYLGPRPIMKFDSDTTNIPYHYEELYSNMTQTHVLCDCDTEEIENMIEKFIDGSFSISNSHFEFYDLDNQKIDIGDISRQKMHLGTILLLLKNLGLPENSILIIDRIDKDMDEEYQLKTAEILAELTNLLDLLIIINTDNDFFCDAINRYCDEISIKTYEAVKNDSNEKYNFNLV